MKNLGGFIMKVAVISYSLTGNNEALANSIAEELVVEHIKIKETKSRTISSIVLDMIFNRTPQVQTTPDKLGNYDLILFLHQFGWDKWLHRFVLT